MDEEKIRNLHINDEDQLNFIFSDSLRIVVTAPAGCGKTTAMVSKIARELGDGKIESNKKVLAMTYSVNAAIKIKDSLMKLLPEIVDNTPQLLKRVDVSNYHHFALRLLYKYGYYLNQHLLNLSEFKIQDDEQVLSSLIESDAQVMINFNCAINVANKDIVDTLMPKYWQILNQKLFTKNIITYNGILVTAIKLFENINIVSFYQTYYRMIIIDEFQDTNLLGYMLIQRLIKDNMIIFLGDDIQKIYGFLGAIDGAMEFLTCRFNAKKFTFKINHRFRNNDRMKQLDTFIRSYAENYRNIGRLGSVLLKKLPNDSQETTFVVDGIKTIYESTKSNVAVLLRAGWQGNVVADRLQQQGIPFFNALYGENDKEFIRFYKVVKEEFHKILSGKALQKDLKDCLRAVQERKNEIYDELSKKFIFDSLYQLLEKLFFVSHEWEETTKEKYIDIDFYIENNGLKHMMEYIDERIILTTIHSSKGLEWDYVIIPQMIAGIFPSYKYVCKRCQAVDGCNQGIDYCKTLFSRDVEVPIKDELNTFYVALTRARKEVFLTTYAGENKWRYPNKENCLINLDGLTGIDFEWSSIIEN